jgi:tryptophan-rich hypothetical protein
MNKINPKKLFNSKWTAVKPINKEKHFMVTKVKFDENQLVTECIIEALLSKKNSQINWHDLKENSQWQQGWK